MLLAVRRRVRPGERLRPLFVTGIGAYGDVEGVFPPPPPDLPAGDLRPDDGVSLLYGVTASELTAWTSPNG